MTRIATRRSGNIVRPAYENAPSRTRGDMSEWRAKHIERNPQWRVR